MIKTTAGNLPQIVPKLAQIMMPAMFLPQSC